MRWLSLPAAAAAAAAGPPGAPGAPGAPGSPGVLGPWCSLLVGAGYTLFHNNWQSCAYIKTDTFDHVILVSQESKRRQCCISAFQHACWRRLAVHGSQPGLFSRHVAQHMAYSFLHHARNTTSLYVNLMT